MACGQMPISSVRVFDAADKVSAAVQDLKVLFSKESKTEKLYGKAYLHSTRIIVTPKI
jgi:hypothetical protein